MILTDEAREIAPTSLCTCRLYCTCMPLPCLNRSCSWCTVSTDSWTYRVSVTPRSPRRCWMPQHFVALASSHLPRWDLEWATAARMIKEVYLKSK